MLDLATIGFNKPTLLTEQVRLLRKHLKDDWCLTVFDNSSDPAVADEIRRSVLGLDVVIPEGWELHYIGGGTVGYQRVSVPDHLHNHALDKAAAYLLERGADHIGFLDHDCFPTKQTSLVPLIEQSGFYGIGQRHSPTQSLYLWPGFCFFSRAWLDSKLPLRLNFDGIRGNEKANDGDCGSMNAPLFAGVDWQSMYRAEHGYFPLREPDDHGLQSWGAERMGDWVHLSNGSNWKDVPDFAGRERLAFEMLAAL